MKKAILDTSFILTCIKEKIDFIEELSLIGIEPILPNEVILELESFEKSKKKSHFKEDAKLALKIIEKSKFKEISIGKGHTDNRIVDYLNANKDVLLATMDKKLKERVKNSKIIVRGKKKLEIVN
jgi:rRNA-processing protein FCF1